MSATPHLKPGDVVGGRYQIQELIGAGGFGAVFRAVQMDLGREVALKVLLSSALASDEGMIRFGREAKLAQQLQHPNTVRLLDFGRGADGVPFIAWELLRGRPLSDVHRREAPLPLARVVRIGSQVLKSLMEAHAAGIVHRDIKPANIYLVDYSGEPDFVKVLDFGIAKQAEGGTLAGLTKLGQSIGTPSYMAPEQVSGNPVTPAADVYAVGLVLSEALTGRVVYRGNSAIEVCMAHISNDPTPLEPAVLQSPLGPVLLRATQKAPERRFANAAEMLAALEAAAGTISSSRQMSSGNHLFAPDITEMPTGAAPVPAAFLPGYPAPPGTAAPTAPAGMPLPPPPPLAPTRVAPKSKGQGCIVAGLIGGGLTLVLALGAILYVAGVFEPDTRSSKRDDDRSERSKDKNDRDEEDEEDEEDEDEEDEEETTSRLDGKSLKRKLEKDGWNVLGETNSTGQGYQMVSITIQRDGVGGSVTLMTYEDPKVRDIVLENYQKNEQVLAARSGDSIVMVTMSDPSEAKRVFRVVR